MTIPMLPGVKEALLMEKVYQEFNQIKCRLAVDSFSDFIFINRFGDCQHQGTLNKALRRIIQDCSDEQLEIFKNPVLLPRFSCHSLRHTFTTRLFENGINIKVIQEILGHADFDTTASLINWRRSCKRKGDQPRQKTMNKAPNSKAGGNASRFAKPL